MKFERQNKSQILLTAFCVLAVSGCGTEDPNPVNPGFSALNAKSNRVVAVAYPLAYISERLLEGTQVSVEFPGAESDNPGNWQPPEETVASMQEADLVITNGPGVTYAQWLIRVTLARNKTCISAADFPIADFITVNDHRIVHRHGPEGEHSHPYMVPYSWLDPAVLEKQARKIASNLVSVYPDNEETITRNLGELSEDLKKLTRKLEDLRRTDQLSVLSANPNLKFLTRAAGINDIHLLWLEGIPEQPQADIDAKSAEDSGPDQPELRWVETDGARAMLWPSTLGAAPEITGWQTINIDLLDKQPESGDYLSVMDDNIEQLVSLLN
ncbi:MAG: zinc ABC transporter substrate-binding protein [Planctomycetota bacterium]